MRIPRFLLAIIAIFNVALLSLPVADSQSEDLPGIVLGRLSHETPNSLDWYFVYSAENQDYIYSTPIREEHMQSFIKWSPDRQTVALIPCSFQNEIESQKGCEIYFMDRSGNAEKVLEMVYMGMPIWSPNSGILLFHGGNYTNCSGIVGCPWMIHALNRAEENLIEGYQHSPIPGYEILWKDDSLYFIHGLETNQQHGNLYRMDMSQPTSESELVQEVFLPLGVGFNQISPDLNWRFEYEDSNASRQCEAGCRLILINSFTGEARYLTEKINIQNVSWSPDSQSLIFSTLQDDLYSIYHLSIISDEPRLLVSSHAQEIFLPTFSSRRYNTLSPLANPNSVISPDNRAFIYGSHDSATQKVTYHIHSLTSDAEMSNIFTTDGYADYVLVDWIPPLPE